MYNHIEEMQFHILNHCLPWNEIKSLLGASFFTTETEKRSENFESKHSIAVEHNL